MDERFDTEKLQAGCSRLGIELSSAQCARMMMHLDLVAKWNKKMNLTAIRDKEKMVAHHLLDSLSVCRFVKKDRFLDIGTGAGFPGMPLAILCPDLHVTLLDSRRKRIEFLRNTCRVLGLANVSLVHGRVEDYRPAQAFDTLAARAFSSLSELLDKSAALLRPSCRLIAMKGKRPGEEMASLSRPQRQTLRIEPVRVPFLPAQRHLVIMDF